MLGSQNTLTDKVTSVTEELSSVNVERANFRVDLDEITELEQWMKDDVGKSLSSASTEVQRRYENIVEAVNMKIQADLVDG